MKTCIIFCAAAFEALAAPIEQGDIVIAADGGLRHAEKLGITPDVILGDFDSLGYVPTDAQLFPVEKDDTDAMLAVRQGLKLGHDRFVLYGGLEGPRLDHTIANLQTLQFLADNGAVGYLVGENQVVTTVTNGRLTFPPESEGTVSVFCMGLPATGVTLKGLKYPLAEGTLTPGFPLGVSNSFTGQAAAIEVKNGTLLVIFDRTQRPG